MEKEFTPYCCLSVSALWWASSVVPDDYYVNTLFQFVNTFFVVPPNVVGATY